MITRSMAWPGSPYAATQPPPLCFTIPAGSKIQSTKVLQTGGGLKVTLATPRLAMDPSDRTTWQRPYIFGTP